MATKIKRLVPLFNFATLKAEIGADGVPVPETFGAKFELSNGVTGIAMLAVEDGAVRVTNVQLEERPGAGITGLTLWGISVAELRHSAVRAMGWVASSRLGAATVNAAAAESASPARRRRMSSERLERVAAIVAAGGTAAEIERRIMEAEHVGERQARRLKKLAMEVTR